MSDEVYLGKLMERVDALEGEIERLKRDLLRSLATRPHSPHAGLGGRSEVKSLFGSVRGGDITEKMIEEAKQALFRGMEDL